ncbi:unnamed protein product [Moneuplotes crassus]|uniref:Uncharacterized protein n=1 Tax=Euplotes crassus TaxID=5936 RepID=A0AAD1Y753_EUPCR|nr:unnamed protein product [Moneuplotes crassus]
MYYQGVLKQVEHKQTKAERGLDSLLSLLIYSKFFALGLLQLNIHSIKNLTNLMISICLR